ncbi:MAG UNVERIFIED_CONTAM: hypothetical protein LVT10_06235 [Anaerolineae bacterium]|jgi:Na+/proline symporter
MLENLMQELSFTPEDLVANQHGLLSQRQRSFLVLNRRKNALLGGALMVIFILVTATLLYLGSVQSNLILQILGVMLLCCSMGASWVIGLNWIRASYDLSSGQLNITVGKAQHVIRQFGNYQQYSVRIGERVEVTTHLAGFKSFVPAQTYRLYRTSHTATLLSIEPVTDATGSSPLIDGAN